MRAMATNVKPPSLVRRLPDRFAAYARCDKVKLVNRDQRFRSVQILADDRVDRLGRRNIPQVANFRLFWLFHDIESLCVPPAGSR